MKTIFTLGLILFGLSFLSFAQPEKGMRFIGGSVNGSYKSTPPQSNYKSENYSFSLNPGFGKFISEKYQIDLGLGYSMYGNWNNMYKGQVIRLTTETYSVRFGITRYFPISEKLYFNLGIGVSPKWAQETEKWNGVYTEGETRNTYVLNSTSVSPGLTYFLNNKWLIYSYMGGLSHLVKYDEQYHKFGHEVNFNLSANNFGIGVRYLLGLKKTSEK